MLPKNRPPAHPGEILKRVFLDDLGINQTELARHLGWKPGKVNEIINGKRGVSSEAALSLSDALGTSPEFWLNLQQSYDLWVAIQKHEKKPRLRHSA